MNNNRNFKNIENSVLFKKSESTYPAITSLFIAVTSSCNYNCKYCCRYDVENEISVGDIIKSIESIPTLKRVKLSGGEVTINFEDCLEIIRYCTYKNIETQINTNGTLLNKEKIVALEDAGLDYLHFSFDFVDREEYSNYYKVKPEMHDKIIENIELSLSTKIDVIVETIICRDTIDRIIDIHKFLNKIGVKIHEIQNGIPQEKKNCWSEVLDSKETITVIKNIIKNKQSETEIYFSCTGFDLMKETLDKSLIEEINVKEVYFPACISGKHQVHLASNGDILLCELGCPEVIGNILNGKNIMEIITKSAPNRCGFCDTHKCRRAIFFTNNHLE